MVRFLLNRSDVGRRGLRVACCLVGVDGVACERFLDCAGWPDRGCPGLRVPGLRVPGFRVPGAEPFPACAEALSAARRRAADDAESFRVRGREPDPCGPDLPDGRRELMPPSLGVRGRKFGQGHG